VTEYLTLVCRSALVVYEPACDRSTGEPVGGPFYRATDASVQLARGYDSMGDYSIGGAWAQCGEAATFTGLTLTEAVDEAVRAGWDVDSPWLGFFTRGDLCPACNPRWGRRAAITPGDRYRTSDTYAIARD
jgi:hypothetical protein